MGLFIVIAAYGSVITIVLLVARALARRRWRSLRKASILILGLGIAAELAVRHLHPDAAIPGMTFVFSPALDHINAPNYEMHVGRDLPVLRCAPDGVDRRVPLQTRCPG